VPFQDRIQSLLHRLSTYSPIEVGLELCIIGVVVFAILKFVQGTRAAGALKGLLLLLVLATIASRVLGSAGSFQRLGLLYDRFLALFAVALVVIFQPELRRALVRLGETPFLRGTPKDIKFTVNEIGTAAVYLTRAKFGAIIAIERQIGLSGFIEGGTVLNAELSSRLLQTIFFPGSALHDLAVVIRGRKVFAAGVQLPLAEPSDMPEDGLGSRHRAAVGLSQECDAIVIVVSEETGGIRIAERGKLSDRYTAQEFREELERRLTTSMRKARREQAQAAAQGEGGNDPGPPRDGADPNDPTDPPDPSDPNQASLSGHPGLSEDIDARQNAA
jgi:diadenylate cyclase